jgi:hypothetical protein
VWQTLIGAETKKCMCIYDSKFYGGNQWQKQKYQRKHAKGSTDF